MMEIPINRHLLMSPIGGKRKFKGNYIKVIDKIGGFNEKEIKITMEENKDNFKR